MAMAPNQETGQLQQQQQQKTLHVWTKPIDQQNEAESANSAADGAQSNNPEQAKTYSTGASSLKEAVSMIKTEDFANVANAPCARQGFMTGIASGAGVGGLHFVLRGNLSKSANWAVGVFVFGSMASFEYCQYLRRVERLQMKRHIEVVTENRREQAKKLAEARIKHQKLEDARKAAERPWYKFW